MGMSADELATQREAQRLAEQQKAAGIQQGIAGVGNVAMGGISKATGDKQILEDAKAAEEKRLADERRAAKAAEGTN